MTGNEYMDLSIENTFNVLTGERSFEEILENATEPPIFFIEPGGGLDDDQIDVMIEHYELFEEYEKCGTLLKMKSE